MSDSKGLGRFFKGEDQGDAAMANTNNAEADKTIAALQARITELEGAAGRVSFIDLDEDQLTQIAAEDAAVIIRAARVRAGKLIEQATETLQQAESEREQIRASSELDARQTREAANVDARKLRAEATATLETARDQAAQLLEATQNDADAQSAENQALIAKLLDDATRRANDVVTEAEQLKARIEAEVATHRSNTENELAALVSATQADMAAQKADADRQSSEAIAVAKAEAQRIQTETTNATKAALESASADARALGEEASRNSAATIAEAQAKLASAQAEAEQIVRVSNENSSREAAAIIAAARADAEALRAAAVKYRDDAIAAADSHRAIIDDVSKQINTLRSKWFDAQDGMIQAINQAGSKFTEVESSAASVSARISDARSHLDETFRNVAGEIKASKESVED